MRCCFYTQDSIFLLLLKSVVLLCDNLDKISKRYTQGGSVSTEQFLVYKLRRDVLVIEKKQNTFLEIYHFYLTIKIVWTIENID